MPLRVNSSAALTTVYQYHREAAVMKRDQAVVERDLAFAAGAAAYGFNVSVGRTPRQINGLDGLFARA